MLKARWVLVVLLPVQMIHMEVLAWVAREGRGLEDETIWTSDVICFVASWLSYFGFFVSL